MVKHECVIIADYSQDSTLSLNELCDICHVSPGFIQDLMTYDILHPAPSIHDQWIFNVKELERVKTVLRLQQDLELNLAGISLVLELLVELENLRGVKQFYDKHFLR